MTSPILVRVDDRLRLAGALLAAGEWPDREQAAKPYKPHRVAEQARKYFGAHNAHPAVRAVNALAGSGGGLAALYDHALHADWPDDLGTQIEGFKSAAALEAFWAETQADWQQAEGDVREVLARAEAAGAALGQFLADLFGAQSRSLVFTPNLLFPGQQPVVVGSLADVVACQPPPQAWGASPPWRYHERPDEVLAALSQALTRFLFEANLPPEHEALKSHAEVFALAAAVLFLRQAEGDAAGDQFMLMEKRVRKLPNLPAVVAALEPLLAGRRAEKYAGFAEYVPLLANRL